MYGFDLKLYKQRRAEYVMPLPGKDLSPIDICLFEEVNVTLRKGQLKSKC